MAIAIGIDVENCFVVQIEFRTATFINNINYSKVTFMHVNRWRKEDEGGGGSDGVDQVPENGIFHSTIMLINFLIIVFCLMNGISRFQVES